MTPTAKLVFLIETSGGRLTTSDQQLRCSVPYDAAYLLPRLRRNKADVMEFLRHRELCSLFAEWMQRTCCRGLVLSPVGNLHISFAQWLLRRKAGLECSRVAFERLLQEAQIPVMDGLACGISHEQSHGEGAGFAQSD